MSVKYMFFSYGIVGRKSGNAESYKRINKIDSARAKRKMTKPATPRCPRDGSFPKGFVSTDALAQMRHSTETTRCNAIRRIVIVFYWRRVVLARPSRVSLAKPTSKAVIPATSAPEAARRVAYRKWIHRCRALINQISITITAHMRSLSVEVVSDSLSTRFLN